MSNKKVDSTMYRRMVGKLVYLANTRPYIYFSVSTVSQLLAEPQLPHLNAMKEIFW